MLYLLIRLLKFGFYLLWLSFFIRVYKEWILNIVYMLVIVVNFGDIWMKIINYFFYGIY